MSFDFYFFLRPEDIFVFGMLAGIILWMFCMLIVLGLHELQQKRNVRDYLYQLDDHDRKLFFKCIDEMHCIADDLATGSNLNYFKEWHNDISDLECFLNKKRLQ